MIRLSFSIGPGARLVRQGLQNLRAEIPKIGRLRIYETAERIMRKMQKYPPTRQGQRYIRTFRFRDSWTIARADNGNVLSNRAPYAIFVVGNAYGQGQARVHVGRWPLFRDVADAEVERLPKTIQENIAMVARRSFGGA